MSEPSSNPLRRSLRALSHGVYVLSVGDTQRDDYLIVSLAMQCSVEPPQVALALSINARILPAFRSCSGGVLGILDAEQRAAVRRYGTPGGVRQPPVHPARSSAMHAIPPEASFWLELQIAREIAAGDHVVFIAAVVGAGVGDGAGVGQPAHADDVPDQAGSDGSGLADTEARVPFRPLTLAESGFPYAG